MPAIFKIALDACPAATHRRESGGTSYETITSYPFSYVRRVVEVTGGKHLPGGLRVAIARFGADVLEANPGRSFIVTAHVPRPHRKPPGWDALVRNKRETGGHQWVREGEGPWFTSEQLNEPITAPAAAASDSQASVPA